MWIEDDNGDLVNLAHAIRVSVECEEPLNPATLYKMEALFPDDDAVILFAGLDFSEVETIYKSIKAKLIG